MKFKRYFLAFLIVTFGVLVGASRAYKLTPSGESYELTPSLDYDLVDFTPAPQPPQTFRIEAGSVVLTETIDAGHVQTVNFTNTYSDPVVVHYLTSFNGSQSVSTRIRNLTSTSMEIFMEEHDNEGHATEEAHYIVAEAGEFTLPDGTLVEAGKHGTTNVHNQGESFPYGDQVKFDQGFSSAPVVVSSLNTYNNTAFMESQVSGTSNTDFQISQEQAEAGSAEDTETIGWIAVQEDSGTLGGEPYQFERESRDGSGDGVENTAHSLSFTNFSDSPVLKVSAGPMDSSSGTDGCYARGAGTLSSTNHSVYCEETENDGQAHGDEPFQYIGFENGFDYSD